MVRESSGHRRHEELVLIFASRTPPARSIPNWNRPLNRKAQYHAGPVIGFAIQCEVGPVSKDAWDGTDPSPVACSVPGQGGDDGGFNSTASGQP